MANGKNCGNCAYVQKNGNRLWCPFHDEYVSNRLVCDDFLDSFQSPQWQSLAAGMSEDAQADPVPQLTAKDKAALAIMGCIFLVCIAVMFM